MTKTLDDLRAARELISRPKRWVKNHFALNAEGQEVTPIGASGAVRFCMIGACFRVAGGDNSPRVDYMADALLSAAERIAGYEMPVSLTYFNDATTTTHKKVLELFDKAIEMLEARQ